MDTSSPATQPPPSVTPSSAHWLVNVNFKLERELVDLAAAPSIVRPVIGIVTYEAMALCLGWPEKELGYEDILALRADPEGWAKYDCAKAEWGQRPLVAYTDPATSSTGRSLLLALYAIAAGKLPEELTEADVTDSAVVGYVEDFALLVASLVLAGGLQLPLLERWSGLVPWVLLWGLLAFAGCAVVADRLRPHPSKASLDERDAQPESGASGELSEAEIRRLLRLDALLHPATLVPLAVVVVSLGALLLPELDRARGIAAAIVIASHWSSRRPTRPASPAPVSIKERRNPSTSSISACIAPRCCTRAVQSSEGWLRRRGSR